ncbi:rhomboid family intramembrane serine protease [Nocardioides yefusunii]|uniref:Rhomboid family intramembrane serine protease n=2 Tax=Nocardioides yefusunii TaxID=2500546 RepID=A0ABW1R3Z6_9ACTN|nr:rhomboid family intramembrane serine protease [Nocardioides yefusunii]
MNQAAVGFQCPDCVAQGVKQTRQGMLPFGGRASRDPRTVTIALIAINIAVFVLVRATGGLTSKLASALMLTPVGSCSAVDGSGWYPSVTSGDLCTSYGLSWSPGFTDGALWQILSHGFVHQEFLHIAMNLLALWVLGPNLERVLGRSRFLAVYLVSVFVAGVTIMWFAEPYQSTLGASSGVFGLLGATLVLVWKVGGDVRSMAGLLAVNVAITLFVPNISWQGHLGGFVGGALVALLMVLTPRGERRSTLQWSGVALLVVIAGALLVARTAQLLPA